jgi:hypothetical protein
MSKALFGMAAAIFIAPISVEQHLGRLPMSAQEGAAQAGETVTDDPLTIYEVEVNRQTGALVSAPVRLSTRLPNSWALQYSKDGRRLAYLSATGAGGVQQVIRQARPLLSIRSIDTGQTTEFPTMFSGPVFAYDWSPDGRVFVFRSTDQGGGYGLHLIDATTGDLRPLAIGTPSVVRFLEPHWAGGDSRRLYYGKGVPGTFSGQMMEQDLESGVERLFFDWSEMKSADGAVVGPRRNSAVSPDRRNVAGLGGSGGFGNSTLWVASIEAKTARELPLSGDFSSFNGLPFSWTADSQALLVKRADGQGPQATRSLWLVPIDGSAPVKLAINLPIQNLAPSVHPKAVV